VEGHWQRTENSGRSVTESKLSVSPRAVPSGFPRDAICNGLCGVVAALQDLFHAGQAGVEGDLDQPPPDLFAAVLVIGQVEGGVREQVAVGCRLGEQVMESLPVRGMGGVLVPYVRDPVNRYLLAGLLSCGVCGRRMESAWSNGKPAYRCRPGRTSAMAPDPALPKNTYVREDKLLRAQARARRHGSSQRRSCCHAARDPLCPSRSATATDRACARVAVRSGQGCLGGHQVSRADPGCSVRLPLAWASTGVDCGRGSVRSDCCPSRAIGKDRCCGGPFRLALQKEPTDVCPVCRIGQAEPPPDAATATTATPARAIAGARRCQAGRRPADPVNQIVTSKTAASEGPLRRRRRWSPAPGSTWQPGQRMRTTPPTPAPRPGRERTPPATGAR
jgi:hypothetical protein